MSIKFYQEAMSFINKISVSNSFQSLLLEYGNFIKKFCNINNITFHIRNDFCLDEDSNLFFLKDDNIEFSNKELSLENYNNVINSYGLEKVLLDGNNKIYLLQNNNIFIGYLLLSYNQNITNTSSIDDVIIFMNNNISNFIFNNKKQHIISDIKKQVQDPIAKLAFTYWQIKHHINLLNVNSDKHKIYKSISDISKIIDNDSSIIKDLEDFLVS